MDNGNSKIEEWGREYRNLFVSQLLEIVGRDEAEAILSLIDGTCRECWNDDAGCQCWNDE